MNRPKSLGKITTALLAIIAFASCDTPHEQAASDLLDAFQSGCSLNGNYLQLALNQTQGFAATVQDLQKNNHCSNAAGALSAIQNLQTQIASVNNSSYASQISDLSNVQRSLMLQMNATSDPSVLSNLSTTYGTNLLDMAQAQSYMNKAAGSNQTTLQVGATQLNGYLSQLFSNQSDILRCAQDDPAVAAQLGAGMIAIAGSFTSTVAGTALSLAGNAMTSVLGYIQNSSFSEELRRLDLIKMTTALPCGLEQMTDIYCQAQDIKDITHLEQCAYNPSGPDCDQLNVGKKNVETTEFWQGLEVLMNHLPALQIWVNQVVTGITPSNPYAAQEMNDAAAAVSTMDTVSRLAQGVMKDEEVKIATLTNVTDQEQELRNGLQLLEAVLAYGSASVDCVNSPFGGSGRCQNTPVFLAEGTATKILYDLVNRPLDCIPGLGSKCQDAILIPLDGLPSSAEKNYPKMWLEIEANAGGLPTATGGRNLIGVILEHQLALERQKLNQDPSDLLEKVNAPSGEGLPSPVAALKKISDFLNSSVAFFKEVPASLLDGGESMRPGILGALADSQTMITEVITQLGKMTGNPKADLDPLAAIYNALSLAKDRNYIFNRLNDQIKLDIHTRIKAGQVPANIYDILAQGEVDPTVGLTQIKPEQMEQTLAALGQAQSTAQLNVQEFAGFFAEGFNNVLLLLKKQADDNREPMVANPRTAPNRAGQAHVCLLLASSLNQWPTEIDPALCKGLSYASELTGQVLDFETYYSQLQNGSTRAPQRMCAFYRFYRSSENYVHVKQN